MDSDHRASNAHFAKGLARAFAGAILFGLPLLMTMEMWWLGFTMPAWKLVLLLALFFPFLVLLSWHAGFELGELRPGLSMRELVGKVSLQAVPASIGALLSQSQLGEHDASQSPRGGADTYGGELFIMMVGALFLAFNMAPTEEMVLIAVNLSDLATCGLILASLVAMHIFVYGAAFRGKPEDHRAASSLSVLLRFTVVGYALACLVSAYMLWTFGRLDGLALAPALQVTAVLGFPAAIGAAAARLIL
ncbi:MAG: conserved rane protein of unknown function [Ramlibacter sp.]|nr:conserved rane protein of unknown function [Ramlibacter sp.]